MPKADAKNQMLNTACQKTHAKNQMLKKCKHDLSSKPTQKVMKYEKTKEKGVTVAKQFKINEFQNGMFLKPSSYYNYRGDNLQHSVVNNNETQSQNSRAVAFDSFPGGSCATGLHKEHL